MEASKPRVVKDFDKMDEAIQEQVKLTYSDGFHKELVSYKNKEGKTVTALPFETDEKYYLIRMTVSEAIAIIEDDDDFDDDGSLRDEVREEFEEKYEDLSYINLDGDEVDDDEDDDDLDD